MLVLRCLACGVVYDRAAIARDYALTFGAPCRRCGGELKFGERRRTVGEAPKSAVAVRSTVRERKRVPFA